MPELRTAYITGQQVIAGQDNVASETALLSRNVALVKVVIADAGGLDINGTHTMKLTNVPTTLNWEGVRKELQQQKGEHGFSALAETNCVRFYFFVINTTRFPEYYKRQQKNPSPSALSQRQPQMKNPYCSQASQVR